VPRRIGDVQRVKKRIVLHEQSISMAVLTQLAPMKNGVADAFSSMRIRREFRTGKEHAQATESKWQSQTSRRYEWFAWRSAKKFWIPSPRR
jgi:hypothetical protein